jgi:hypothetical protein
MPNAVPSGVRDVGGDSVRGHLESISATESELRELAGTGKSTVTWLSQGR